MLERTSRQRMGALEDELGKPSEMAGGSSPGESNRPWLVHGRPVNHILHLLLSVFTVGLWLVVWLILTVTGGEERVLVQVDERCRISTHEI